MSPDFFSFFSFFFFALFASYKNLSTHRVYNHGNSWEFFFLATSTNALNRYVISDLMKNVRMSLPQEVIARALREMEETNT